MPEVNISKQIRTKNIKEYINKNNPLAFTAGNTFPSPKSMFTSRMPTGKPTVEEAFPVLEANLEANLKANDNSKKVVAKMPSKKRLTPLSIMVCDTISAVRSCTILKVLFDPGSTVTFISRKCLPRHCKPCPVTKSRSVNTVAGSCTASKMVVLRAIRLPELDKNRVIDQHKALMFDGNIRYDLILDADFLAKSGIDIKYSSGIVEWFNSELPMREPNCLDNHEYLAMAEALKVHREEEALFGRDWYDPDCFATTILDAKFEKVNVDDVVEQLTHLSKSQRDDLRNVLRNFTKLFDGTLGVYPHRKFHIDVMPGAKPKHVRPYAIARIRLKPFKKELDHLTRIGVLSPQGASEWGSPTFITPKKDGRIRWVSDLRELNK